MRRFRIPPLVPLLAVLALLLAAASPAFQGGARDGKARAIHAGEIDVEALQRAAVEEGTANFDAAAIPVGGAECTAGFAGPYPCENVDLASIVHNGELLGATGSDVWGWTDPESGREIAIPTTTYGMAFVDVTEPSSPTVLGRVFVGADGEDRDVIWRDVKVYDDHAYLVSEHDGTHLIVFDLTRLRGIDSDQGTLEPDTTWEGFNGAHNIAVNEDTGFAYVIGANTCDGGLTMIDLSTPKEPELAGCFAEDGYTHDVQCVIYEGPDAAYQGQEICFASNEDTLTIVDVTDKQAPYMVSRIGYDSATYTHQGWLSEDHRWFVFGDELDEVLGPQSATTTYISDVADLDAPGDIAAFEHETAAIDHNLYIRDNYIIQANYSAGLRVMEFTDESLSNGEMTQVAYFDVDPGPDAPVFAGAWTAYPYFASGTIVLNSFDSGLFVLTTGLEFDDGGSEGDGGDGEGDRCGKDGDQRGDDGRGRDGDNRRDDRCGGDDDGQRQRG